MARLPFSSVVFCVLFGCSPLVKLWPVVCFELIQKVLWICLMVCIHRVMRPYRALAKTLMVAFSQRLCK